MPETKEELKSVFIKTQKIPNEKVVELQRSVIKLIGFNPDFGVSCLNRINTDFPNDRELMMKMQHFAVCAEVSCQ